MDVQDSTDANSAISQLIDSLSYGDINPSDFGVEINYFSKTMSKNLFHDSFPKFNSNLRTKCTDVFIRYFFNDQQYPINELWKFVDYKDFWIQLRIFHDYIYDKSMILNDAVNFFEKNLSSASSKLCLSFLEQRVIEQLDKTPYIRSKDIAEIFNVSEKTISHLMNDLRSKGILLGSSIDYKALDFFEFFTFGTIEQYSKKVNLLNEYKLFPSFSFVYGVTSERIMSPSSYIVMNKRIVCNIRILTMGISLEDWSRHSPKRVEASARVQEEKQSSFYIAPVSKDYVLRLARNCEIDFKRPRIKKIADNFDVSIRTLFRLKSKFIKMGIIEPKITLDNEELMTVLIISDKELVEFYNKVPSVKSYETQDYDHNIKWITFLTIFPNDFHFIYRKINNSMDVYQVMGKKVYSQIKNRNGSLLHSKQKI
ncbi:winged helix-turn-helix transcriptional regulator [Candidatus Heimdallarchaeota archaeon]|nr:MAG: winged helix-turn-helix transcriptional regulator [Candidatus Heimdallarchaeota archaeon]